MKWRQVLAASSIGALLALTGCGGSHPDELDELSFSIPGDGPGSQREQMAREKFGRPAATGFPRGEERRFLALVHVGCDLDDEARVDDYDVSYEEERVIVTFMGEESDRLELCLSTKETYVELDEPLDGRRLCDGSSDPPVVVQQGLRVDGPSCAAGIREGLEAELED